MPHSHVAQGTTVTYIHDPPTSGCHYNLGSGVAPIAPGVYPATSAAKLTAEYWVHNLKAQTWSSPYFVDGKIFLGDEHGNVTVFQPGKEKKVLAVNQNCSRPSQTVWTAKASRFMAANIMARFCLPWPKLCSRW